MKAGWKVKTLGSLCDILDNQRKPITKRDRTPGEYPYYGATGVLDFVEGYLFDEPLILVGEDGAKWASGENTAFAEVLGKQPCSCIALSSLYFNGQLANLLPCPF